MPPSSIASRVRAFTPLKNRLERLAGQRGNVIINDSYSNDIDALAAALTFAQSQSADGRVTLLLGELQPSPDGPARLAQLLADGRTEVLTVGETPPPGLPPARHYATVAELRAALTDLDWHDRTILVKGASYQHFSRLVAHFIHQQHRTELRVDLDALRHNFLALRAAAGSGHPVICMVKASAYGSGALPVARALVDLGADYLAVAYPDEGKALRDGGITTPIIVLNVDIHLYDYCARHGLEPVIHDGPGLRTAAARDLPLHLELDTGMGRLGFPPAKLEDLAKTLARHPEYRVASIFTHLASSDDRGDESYTETQLTTFRAAYERLTGMLTQRPFAHVLNSAAVGRYPPAPGEGVRLGIGLFGLEDVNRLGLRPVLTLLTHVKSIRRYDDEATVGYGRRGRAAAGTRIAVLSIGYADGLPRTVGEGKYAVLIAGRPAPIVGSVCMDMTMVDVTDIPGARTGVEAIVFGPEHPVEELARTAGTIPYEILTGVGPRVRRVYLGE